MMLLDDVIGFKVSGSRDFLFVNDLFYPDSFLREKHAADEDICCRGTDCMAWRWSFTVLIKGTEMEFKKTNKGYCGLAGKPEERE